MNLLREKVAREVGEGRGVRVSMFEVAGVGMGVVC